MDKDFSKETQNTIGYKRKVAIIGCGRVGMSIAMALLCSGIPDELVLLDVDKKRAAGEAEDLCHGKSFAPSDMQIRAGDYTDCGDATVVLLCAGVAQKPGEDRPSLFTRNAEVFREIVPKLERVGFRGIYLVVTNPVDALTALTWRLSSLPASRVIGSGTVLDSARLRFLLGGHFSVSPQSIHAYVLGEHGDSEFVPWSIATIGGKSLLEICKGSAAPSCDGDKCSIGGGFLCDERCLAEMEEEVRDAGARIIEAKGSTCYGIGMSAARIVKAILLDEHAVLPLSISTELSEMHQGLDVFTGIPAVVGRHGILETVELPLREDEEEKFLFSCRRCGEILHRIPSLQSIR